MSFWLIVLAGVQAGMPAPVQVMADARRATTVAVRCPEQAQAGEVLVCGRRRSDRYRLPLVGGTGGTRLDPTPAQREAMLTPANNCEEMSVFMVGCGSLGFGLGVSSDGRSRLLRPRDLSP